MRRWRRLKPPKNVRAPFAVLCAPLQRLLCRAAADKEGKFIIERTKVDCIAENA